jgi:type VI protein secretion system component VasK
LVIKEQAQVRQNQFLQIALQSPIVQQVVGMEGIAELLRQAAKTLDMNPDHIVPPAEVIKQRMAQAQQQQAAQQQAEAMAAQANGQAQAGGSAPAQKPGAQLMNGAPVSNNFAPQQGIGS